MLIKRLDQFGEGQPEPTRDRSEGRGLRWSPSTNIRVLDDGALILLDGEVPPPHIERRVRELLSRHFYGGGRVSGTCTIAGPTILGHINLSSSIVAFCMSDRPLPDFADECRYDTIVEIDNVNSLWRELATIALGAFGATSIRRSGVRPISYARRDATLHDDEWDLFPGTVKPESHAQEHEVRFVTEFTGQVAPKAVVTCPALCRHARIVQTRTASGWRRAE